MGRISDTFPAQIHQDIIKYSEYVSSSYETIIRYQYLFIFIITSYHTKIKKNILFHVIYEYVFIIKQNKTKNITLTLSVHTTTNCTKDLVN